ncbi:hypothetical protein [Pseudomonas hormoni]
MEIRQYSKFDVTVTSIFKGLAASYPAPCQLDATVVGYDANTGNPPIHASATDRQTSTCPTEDENFFADIVRWLASQSYLVFDTEDACRFSGALVTEKGLKLFEALPSQ